MSPYIRHSAAPDATGRRVAAGLPDKADGLAHIGLEVFTLSPGQSLTRNAAGLETGLVLLAGEGRIEAPGLAARIGGRASPFEGPGHAAYFPAGTGWRFMAETPCELALCHAAVPGGEVLPPRVIGPEDVQCFTRGEGVSSRLIRSILPETEPAQALLLVEVITPGGHWSSYPPHKHDTAGPEETALEEIYYHRFRHPEGFGFQRVYGAAGLDEALTLADGAAVLVPRGYHPVAAAPGYDLYYLNVMAGPVRLWRAATDPAHAWL